MQQEFQWCNKKPSSAKSMNDKWNCIRNHSLLYHLLFTASGIPYCMCPSLKVLLDFLQYQLFLSLTVLTVTILFIVNLFLIILDIQILYVIISAITPVSAIAQFYLLFFTVSISYQNLLILSLEHSYQVGFFYQLPISGPSVSVVIISATPLSYFYQHTVSAIKQFYHLFT